MLYVQYKKMFEYDICNYLVFGLKVSIASITQTNKHRKVTLINKNMGIGAGKNGMESSTELEMVLTLENE